MGKTHGVEGEINLVVDPGWEIDPRELTCIVLMMDGLPVPFFLESVRTRGSHGYIVKIDGMDTREAVAPLVGKEVYALDSDLEELEEACGDVTVDGQEIDSEDSSCSEEDEEDDLYADDLVGYTAVTGDGRLDGRIESVDTATANALYVVRLAGDGRAVYIPVMGDFLVDIDAGARRATFDLPDGWPGL